MFASFAVIHSNGLAAPQGGIKQIIAMRSANVKRHALYDATQARLRLIISALEERESTNEGELESLDFTVTAPDADGEEERDVKSKGKTEG